MRQVKPVFFADAAAREATYTREVAISAVPYDAVLVAELVERLTPHLLTAPYWGGNTHGDSPVDDSETSVESESSRLALVLHQRLWRHDRMTRLDEVALCERLANRAGSVGVVMLDDTPIPPWLAKAPRLDYAAKGLDGATEFTIDALATLGGSPIVHEYENSHEETPQRGWRDGPAPFLAQPRALSALRRELDDIADQLQTRLDAEQSRGTDRIIELHSLPNRRVARVDDVGISFSWVTGGMGTVADGRLMVIQWEGVGQGVKGIRALQSAAPVRERVYHAEGNDAETWRWRADDLNGRACSTENLVAEWFAGASLSHAMVP